MNEERIEEFQL